MPASPSHTIAPSAPAPLATLVVITLPDTTTLAAAFNPAPIAA